MPFDANDPRSTLESVASSQVPTPDAFAKAQYLPFSDNLARVSGSGTRTWVVRTQNCAVAYSIGHVGDVVGELGAASERMIAVPDRGTVVEVAHDGRSTRVDAPAVVTVPPGEVSVSFLTAGPILQTFTSAATDVLALSMNAEAYQEVPPNVRVHIPDPSVDTSLVVYQLDDYGASLQRFGSIFRSTNLMLNFINDRQGPRDPSKLSPHSHDDFEQCSIQLTGQFRHHVRTPWIPNMATWREDEHIDVDGPAAIIFPPPMVHTSQATGPGLNRLIDVFSPPRLDFLAKSGWVLNAADYELSDIGRI